MDDPADHRQRRCAREAATAFLLQPRVGERREHDVPVPPEERPSFEVIEAQLGFQLLILLLDGPPLVRGANQCA